MSMYISDLDGDEEESSKRSPIVSGGATLKAIKITSKVNPRKII